MRRKKLWQRTLAAALSVSLLAGNNVAVMASAVSGDGSKSAEAGKEEALREAIRESDELAKEYPNGRFNFLATQYETKEGQEYVEVGVIRQGGTEGEASVQFRAIDVTSSYGEDYEIYTTKDKKKGTKIEKGEDAIPLVESAYVDETDLSSSDGKNLVEAAAKKAAGENAAEEEKPDKEAAVEAVPAADGAEASTIENTGLKEVSATGLKDAKSKTTGIKSDRKSWRTVAADSAEEANVREQFDTFLSAVGGSDVELTFEDGEYIQYLYLFPKDDKESEAEEQLIMALLQKDEKAPVGGSYSAYVNIKDNDAKEETSYAFEKEEVTADTDKVSVTIRRTSGTGYIDSIYVGTGEGTANAGADYEAGVKKLDFYAGQTEQTVTIDILDNEYREADRDFYLLISKDGESYEKSGCHVIIKGNGEGTMTAQAVEADAEKITANGSKYGTGQWKLGAADFSGYNHPDASTINANHWSGTWYANTANLSLYGVSSITYHLTNNGSGRSWSWSERVCVKKFLGIPIKYKTVWHDEHEDNFYHNFHGQVYWGRQDGDSTVGVETSQWGGGFGLQSVAGSGNNANASISNIRLNLKKYGYSISAAKDTMYTRIYTLGTTQNSFTQTSQTDITPGMALASVGSRVGNSTTNPSASTGMYRSDALTFRLTNFDSNKLDFAGIEASADNKNFVSVSNSLNVTLNAAFFRSVNLASTNTIYFRPVFRNKNAYVKFTVGDSNKGVYTNVSTNYTSGTNPQFHIGDMIKNIQGKSANAASYQPVFTYRTGSTWSNVNQQSFKAAGTGALKLDSSNSQGAVAEYTIGNGIPYSEIQLSYTYPSVTVRADMNTYRNTYANEVITVDGTAYKCDSDEEVKKLHTDMEKKYKDDTDANIKLSFEYCFNKDYMNGKVTKDPDFGTPQEAELYIYTTKGVADSVETVLPVKSTRDKETIYTFTFEGSWKKKGWVDGSTATVIIVGENGYTSEEIELDFLSTTGSRVITYDASNNLMTDTNGNTTGSLKTPLVYKNLNPMETYTFVGMPSDNFVARWGDYSLDTDNDGNISNSNDNNEIAKAEKRLEELGQDKSLAIKNQEVYFGNSFAYQPSTFAMSKLYYDFVKKDTSTGSNNRIGVQLIEEKATVIKPGVYTKSSLEGATVTVLGTEIMSEGTNGNYFLRGAYEKGQNYLADVVYQGVHFQARCVGTRTLTQTIRTSDVMYPTNFDVQQGGKSTGVRTNGSTSYLQIPEKAGKTHSFSFNFTSKVGVKPNKARVTIYDKKKNVLYKETLTRENISDNFTCQIDLAKAGLKSGARMVIQGIYYDGSVDYVYPEVDTGIIFKRTLSVISVMGSFSSGFGKTLKMFGKIGTKFDLPLDFDLGSLGTQPVDYIDDNGATHNVTQIAFGYNAKVKDKLNELQTKHRAENGGNAMSGRNVVAAYIDSLMENGVEKAGEGDGKADKDDNVDKNKDNADGAQDKNATKTDNMHNSSFDFAFSVAVILTVETGPSTDPNTSGDNFFDSLMLVAAGEAQMKSEIVYTTPIGIDIIVTMKAGGKAVAAFAAGASTKNPYGEAFNLNKDGEDKSFTLTKNDFDIYTKFLLAPTITLGAGVGIGGGKIASVTVSGTADFDFKFTLPVIGTDTSSAGSGTVKLGADLELKILFIKKKWNLYRSESINLFSYGSQSINDMLSDFQENYLYDIINAEDLETVSRDYLKNSSKWQPYDASALKVEAGAENVLKEGVYPYPDAKIVDLSNGLLLAVYLDDPGAEKKDTYNASTVMYSYSADNGTTWSTPAMADNDDTRDEAPYVYKVTDKKALIVWSDASKKLADATDGKTLEDNLASLDISGAWFDISTKSIGAPFTVAQTKVTDTVNNVTRTDFQDAQPMISFDPETKRLLVYYTTTDYEAETKVNIDTSDLDDASAKAEAVTYGDILKGYSLIAVASANLQPDGSFSAFSEPDFVDLAVPFTVQEKDGKKTLDGNKITDPKVVDSDVISYNGLSLYAYTVDVDQDDQTLTDREMFVQIYNYSGNNGEGEFHYPIQITSDMQNDASPQFVRCKNMTYLYWISGGDVKYINITSLVKGLGGADENNYLKLAEVDNTLTENDANDKVRVYYLDSSKGDVIETAVAHKEETDADGNVTSQLIKEFDVRSNGDAMYMLWTDLVTEQKDPDKNGAENIIKETQVFGAYCEPVYELKETEEAYTFEDTDSYSYQFVNGKGRDTYPVSATALKDINDADNGAIAAGTVVPIDYSVTSDINGETGKVQAGDKATRTVQSVVRTGACGWSEPIQVTRNTGDEYNYSDLSFRVTEDNSIQAIFSRGRQTLNKETGAFEMDEKNRLLAVQNFAVTSTLEAGEMTIRRVEDGDTDEESSEKETDSEDNEGSANAYYYPGDMVEFGVDVTNDGFEAIEGVTYRTYMTKDGKIVGDSVTDWEELSPAMVSKGETKLDVYTDASSNAYAEDAETTAALTSESVNRLVGGKTVSVTGRTLLGEEIDGTSFIIELKYKDVNGEKQTVKITKDLLVESKVTVTTDAELISDGLAEVTVNVANAGNKAYTGDIVLKDGEKTVGTMENVTIDAGSTDVFGIEADISGSSFGSYKTNSDGSKQDSLTLNLTYGDKDSAVATDVADVVRKTSVEGGYALDAIKSIAIEASDATDDNAKAETVGTAYTVPANKTKTLKSVFTVDEASDAAKDLASDGNSAEAQMITEWSSSDTGVVFVSDNGLLIPMKEGKAAITATIYPGQREQIGQADSGTGTADDSNEDDFGTIQSEAGYGSYITANGKYLVPEKAITTKTFTVTVSAAEKEASTDTKTDDTKTDYSKTDQKAYVGNIQYKVPAGKTEASAIGAKKNQKTITIPATVQINGKSYKVTSIAASAFKKQTKLKTVKIGKNVKTIGKEAFSGDTALTTVTIGAGVTKIADKAFYGDKKLSKLTLGKNVKTIGVQAFYGNKKLATVTLGSKVTSIGSQAFYGDTAITKVTFGKNVKSIGKQAFYGNTKLTAVTLGTKVTTIGDQAFAGDTALKTVTIGKSVTKIGSKAFYGDKKLTTVTFKSAKVPTIGNKAFSNIAKKAAYKVPSKLKSKFKKALTSKTGYVKTQSIK